MNLQKIIFSRKYWKRLISITLAIFIFIKISNVLNYIYAKDDNWTRILWHNFYEDKGKINNVYIGSSHVFCDINPKLLDELNGQYNFNLASPSQRLNGSYYLLKEADRNNSLSHVYLELYYLCSAKSTFDSNADPIDSKYNTNWINTDYMEMSVNKLEYMLSIAVPEIYPDILFPFVRYRTNLDNWDLINQTIKDKREASYLTYQYQSVDDNGNLDEVFQKQGYNYRTTSLLDENKIFCQSMILEENPMGNKSEENLRKIICYCQNQNIPITLFISPIYELALISTEHYDNYINQIRKIAAEYQIDFYDFNLAKEEYLPIQYGEYFHDINHLNSTGADMFTTFFSKIISEEFAENADYFYTCYAEKLQSAPPAIYGLYYRDFEIAQEFQDPVRTFWIASNREEGMEYRIIMTPNEGDSYMVQDFIENKEFTISLNEHGICTIVAKAKDTPEYVQTLKINY